MGADKRAKFAADLAQLINSNCLENEADVPDFILADYLIDCMDAFHSATRRRQEWFGHKAFSSNHYSDTINVNGAVENMFVDSFVCLNKECGGRLKEVAISEPVDAGVCGDSYCRAYLFCEKCRSFYYRIDIGSHLPFSYEKEQVNIKRVEELPSEIRNMFHQASEEMKAWPEWMQQPEMRNLSKTLKMEAKCALLAEAAIPPPAGIGIKIGDRFPIPTKKRSS